MPAPLWTLLVVSVGCGGGANRTARSGLEPTLAASVFILVESRRAGTRVSDTLRVEGCSRTNESNLAWELRGRDGRVLASGIASGGGFEGAAAFRFRAGFPVARPEVGHLEVYAPDDSGGEGSPPLRTVIPLVVAP